MSLFLMFVLMGVATDTRAVGEAAAIAIVGAIAGDLHALGLYIIGPIVGASLGALAYRFVRGEQTHPEELVETAEEPA